MTPIVLQEIDFLNADTEPIDLWLPMGLHKMVNIHPGNIIVIAGEPDSGKTAFLLNVVRYNMDRHKVHYFNSEMGKGELRKRLELFKDVALDEWKKFKAYERSSNFADVIRAGAGNINIIDFLEIYDEFYKVGGYLNQIHNKLDGAVAIIALQKNKGADAGLGGGRSLEKPRLYLNMGHGEIEIRKAKNWKDTADNPNGKRLKFKLAAGNIFSCRTDWEK